MSNYGTEEEKMDELRAENAKLREQRGRLITALEEAVEYVGVSTWSPSLEKECRAILAEIEGEKK